MIARKSRMTFENSPKTDREKAERILEALGYDLTQNIHDQFMERHKYKLKKY